MKEQFAKFTESIEKLKNNKVITIVVLTLLILTIGFTAHIRTLNIPNLKDVTTEEYLTADLDAFYWLRLAEVLEANGSYPEYDSMRYPSLHLPFSNERLPYTILHIYEFLSKFSEDITLRYVDVIYPVIFFVLSMFVFFFLILFLTKSKLTALISSFFLAIIPAYLFRTMAGVSDHEPVGMFSFFLVLLVFAFSMKMIESGKSLKWAVPLGIVTGFFTTYNIATWSGISAFTLLILPLTVLILWITSKEKESLKKYLLFYGSWLISFLLFGYIFSFSIKDMLFLAITHIRGMIIPFIFIFMIVDYILTKLNINKLKEIGNYRIVVSLVLTIIFLVLASLIFQQNIGFSIQNLLSTLLRPFGGGRTGSTVAENALPYTVDIIGQVGKSLFWVFFVGILIIGIDFSRGIGTKKNKILFSVLWVLMICGILFHRYSTGALFNGESFISKLFYIGSILAFFGAFVWIYFKDKIEVKSENVIILLYTFFMALAGISAIRLLFILTPVICFVAAYALTKTFKYANESKEELVKILLYLALIGVIILLTFSSISYVKSIKGQAPQIGSSANAQWQYAMKWVRENTQPGEIFVHWWDYGYWVQYMGERPTVTDGGHGNGYWDHLIGRYLLTTPHPETALSFLKAHNVSYLLIDPTEIGKYSAYSSIGSDKEGTDRFSFIPAMVSEQSQIQETKNGVIRAYMGGYGLDGDIIYKPENGTQIFIPTQNSGMGGVIIQKENNSYMQPVGVYMYQGKQIEIPIRYLYVKGILYDFKNGTNSGVYIIPRIIPVDNNLQLDEEGAIMYFSEKSMNSLIVQLYLMNDPNKIYNGLTLAHSEPDPIETYLEMYGMNLNEFFYLNGVRGPLKIWEVNVPENIIGAPEFAAVSGEFAQLDNLTLIK